MFNYHDNAFAKMESNLVPRAFFPGLDQMVSLTEKFVICLFNN